MTFRYPLLSQEDKEVILRFLAANGQISNPNPALGSVHHYSLSETIERMKMTDGSERDVKETQGSIFVI